MFEDQEIVKINGPTKKRLWVTILNESYLNNYQIKKRRRYWILNYRTI